MLELSSISTYRAAVYQARAYRSLKALTARILKPYNLTMMQWVVLGFVYDSGPRGVRITTLADEIKTTQAFITITVNSLEDKKMIIRKVDPQDNRAKTVILDPKHKKLVKKIEADMRTELKKNLYDRITAEELQIYVSVLAKFED